MNEIRLGIDNFRFFYLTLPEPYELPGASTTGLTAEQKAELFTILADRHPPFTGSFQILPENRPARYATELHLVRPLVYEDSRFVLILRVLAEYRGGAESDEIIEESVQALTPRIRTDKIYYKARIVPCDRIELDGDSVLDFTPRRLDQVESVYTEVKGAGPGPGAREHTFAVFLDPDFHEYNGKISARFGDWPHENVFLPFVADDYVTISLNIVYPHAFYIDTVLPYFARAFDSIAESRDLSDEDRAFWTAYYGGMDMERSYSRAGNPHWRFTRLPWEA